jgi:acetyl-CoA carboxylase biotin carboxyl carrier protein
MTRNPFDPETLRVLASILTETGLTEIEIAENDSRIRLVRAPAVLHVPISAGSMAAAASGAHPQVVSPADDAPPANAVHSPMVGIAYLSPEPGAAPYVQPGQRVTSGQTLLLIEAMKTYNQIKAPRDGPVTRIVVSAGAPVEYDEPLLVLEP